MIKLSKKGNYGLKALVYLAHKNGNIVKIGDISQDLLISENFLRRIIVDFEKSGLVKTVKGRNGGVLLGKSASKIFLYDIFLSLGEDLNMTECTAGVYCVNEHDCLTTDILKKIQKGFNTILKLYSLEILMKNKS